MPRSAKKTGRNRRAGQGRSGLAWTLVSTGLLAAAGFAVGLVVGVVWETPDLLRGGGMVRLVPAQHP